MSIRIDSRTTASLLAAAFAAILNLAWVDVSAAQPMGSSTATTEKFCNFGMAKGEAQHSCDVPFPAGCAVAHIPGTNQPMSTISKGGATSCRFDEKKTDWKTKITGTCTRCRSRQCSARFNVMFDCSQQR